MSSSSSVSEPCWPVSSDSTGSVAGRVIAVVPVQAATTSPMRGSTRLVTWPNQPASTASARLSTVAREPSRSRQVASTSSAAPASA